ncbi:MAG: hypothetical protein ACOX2I_09955 [Candidatus Ozemobacteraceae bacterium]|jgi:hypothetical protein
MPNLVKSLGYSIGKIHTGLITYLCHKFMEGSVEPLTSFLSSFGVTPPQELVPRREWNSIDLAILEIDKDGKEVPRILVELKVDDHETGTKPENFQTNRYYNLWPNCQAYLFITIGRGEYYHPPRNKQFKWIKIRDFSKAVDCIRSKDQVIHDWLDEIKREINLQENAFINKRENLEDYRAGNWNIYLLGKLALSIQEQLRNAGVDLDVTCGTYGPGPDTILNFDYFTNELYMEINYGGRLNLKISFDDGLSREERISRITSAIDEMRRIVFPIEPRFHPGGKIGQSKTIASFDVGLECRDWLLEPRTSFEDVRTRVFSILEKVYMKTK